MFLFWVAKGISVARVSLTSGECLRDAHYKNKNDGKNRN